MTNLTFEQSVILAIIDKLALGGIVGIMGFIANHIIERYRANEAIRSKVADIRVQRISSLWEQLENVNLEILKVQLEGHQLINDDKSRWTKSELNSYNQNNQIPKLTINHLKSNYGTAINDLSSKINELQTLVAVKRFWLGEEMRDVMLNHIYSLKEYLELVRQDLLSGTKKTLTDYTEKGVEAYLSKEDITDLLKRLK
jgi:hypothetical protein